MINFIRNKNNNMNKGNYVLILVKELTNTLIVQRMQYSTCVRP